MNRFDLYNSNAKLGQRYYSEVQDIISRKGMVPLDAIYYRFRALNFLFCWHPDYRHLWPIANRHLRRMRMMYCGGPYESWASTQKKPKLPLPILPQPPAQEASDAPTD